MTVAKYMRLQERWTTAAAIDSGNRSVADCVDRLNQTGLPFALLVHVEGQKGLGVHVRRNGNESPFRQLADCLAQEVCKLARRA